jgi:hypothetical protein
MGFGCAHLRPVFLVNPEIGWLGQVRWANHCRARATGQAFSILGKREQIVLPVMNMNRLNLQPKKNPLMSGLLCRIDNQLTGYGGTWSLY